MKSHRFPRINLADIAGDPDKKLESFALLNLGLLQAVASGTMTAGDAVECFYHADNCRHVHDHFKSKGPGITMSHGVQLSDLFAALSPEEAQRELYAELEKMRGLSLKLLRSLNAEDRAEHATA